MPQAPRYYRAVKMVLRIMLRSKKKAREKFLHLSQAQATFSTSKRIFTRDDRL
jgi:hypothetical protein